MASTTAQVSLNGKATTQPGTTIDFTTAKKTVTMVAYATGSVTAGQVQVEASQDGTTWVPIRQVEVGPRPRGTEFQGMAYRYWRATIVGDILGGGSTTATFMEAD